MENFENFEEENQFFEDGFSKTYTEEKPLLTGRAVKQLAVALSMCIVAVMVVMVATESSDDSYQATNLKSDQKNSTEQEPQASTKNSETSRMATTTVAKSSSTTELEVTTVDSTEEKPKEVVLSAAAQKKRAQCQAVYATASSVSYRLAMVETPAEEATSSTEAATSTTPTTQESTTTPSTTAPSTTVKPSTTAQSATTQESTTTTLKETTTTTVKPTTTVIETTPPTAHPKGWVDAGHGVYLPVVLLSIRCCESNGDYQASNSHSSARGGFQFLTGSWKYYGHADRYGVTTGDKATPAQQDEAALLTWEKDGTRPWLASKTCWGTSAA